MINESVIELYKEYFILSAEIFERQNEINELLNIPLSDKEEKLFESMTNLSATTALMKGNVKLMDKKYKIQKTISSILKSNWESITLYKELTSSLEGEKYEEAELIKNKIEELG